MLTTDRVLWIVAFAAAAAPAAAQTFPGKILPAGTSPRACATGDFDADGLPDAISANFASHDVTFLAGNGGGGIFGATSLAAGTNPVSICAGDFNNDGVLDAAVANAGSGDVYIYYGGTLATVTTMAAGSSPADIVCFDANLDGLPDLATANTASGDIAIFVNAAGFGFFPVVSFLSTVPSPSAIASGDLDHDGIPDLATASTLLNAVTLWSGDGFGNFSVFQNFVTGAAPSSVAIGDLDGNGFDDLATANLNANSSDVFLQVSAGSFAATAPVAPGVTPVFVSIRDLDGDGRIDICYVNRTPQKLTIFRAAPQGGFAPPITAPTGAGPRHVAWVDWNQDGVLDALVSNAGNLPQFASHVSLILGFSKDRYQSAPPVAAGTAPRGIAAADLNGDGDADIVLCNSASHDATLQFGDGNATFPATQTVALPGNAPSAVETGDFNSDGRPDLFVAYSGSNDAIVTLAAASGAWLHGSPVAAGQSPAAVEVGDWNGDGVLDAVVLASLSGDLRAMVGNGSGGFSAMPPVSAGSTPVALAQGDWNLDGKRDLAAADASGNLIYLYYGSGSGTFSGAGTVATGLIPLGLVSAKIDANASPDLAVANFASGAITILLNSGTGSFSAMGVVPAQPQATALAAVDADGNGTQDLLCCDGGGGISLYINSGAAAFSPGGSWPAGNSPAAIALADWNRDGIPDAAIANTGSNNATILASTHTAAPLGVQQIQTTFTKVSGLATGDLDGDGRPDVFATGGSGLAQSPANVFLANDAALFQPPIVFSIAPAPVAPALADTNGDGALDLVVLSGNTSSMLLCTGTGDGHFNPGISLPTGGQPADLDLCDLNLDGLPDAVVCNFFNNTISIFINSGSTLASSSTPLVPLGPVAAQVADVNADGTPDIVLLGQIQQVVSFMIGSQQGSYTFTFGPSAPPTVRDFVWDDADGDGIPDLLYCDPAAGTVSMFTGSYASLSLSGTFATNANCTQLLVADLDRDGVADLFTANPAKGTCSLLHGLGAGAFGSLEEFIAGPNPASPRIVDLECGGSPDLVVGSGSGTFFAYLRNQTPLPAGAVPFGKGSSGCAGTVALAANVAPRVNEPNFIILCTNAPRSSLGLGIVADAASAWSADPFGLGVLFQIDFLSATELIPFDVFTNVAGTGRSQPLSIPNNPLLVGLHYAAQGLFIETASSGSVCHYGPIPGLVSTRALLLTIQP
jgi:hypothetical protein